MSTTAPCERPAPLQFAPADAARLRTPGHNVRRIIERTTVTREYLLAGDSSAEPERTIDGPLVRLGVWLIELGHRRALRRHRSAEDIAARLDERRRSDLKHFIGLPI